MAHRRWHNRGSRGKRGSRRGPDHAWAPRDANTFVFALLRDRPGRLVASACGGKTSDVGTRGSSGGDETSDDSPPGIEPDTAQRDLWGLRTGDTHDDRWPAYDVRPGRRFADGCGLRAVALRDAVRPIPEVQSPPVSAPSSLGLPRLRNDVMCNWIGPPVVEGRKDSRSDRGRPRFSGVARDERVPRGGFHRRVRATRERARSTRRACRSRRARTDGGTRRDASRADDAVARKARGSRGHTCDALSDEHPNARGDRDRERDEGCIRETYGALLATWQAATAVDEQVRCAMAVVAVDETANALLAWDVRRWTDTRLGDGARARGGRRSGARTVRARARAVLGAAQRRRRDAGCPDRGAGRRALDRALRISSERRCMPASASPASGRTPSACSCRDGS